MSAFMTRRYGGRPDRNRIEPRARRLTFPLAYPPTTKHFHEPSTAIAQFSSGRKSILGLADDGKVWQWNEEEARLVKPLHVDVGQNRVERVFAGMFMSGRSYWIW